MPSWWLAPLRRQVRVSKRAEVQQKTRLRLESLEVREVPSAGTPALLIAPHSGSTTAATFPTNHTASPTSAQSHIFNVMSFGAKGDGVHDDTAAIRAAQAAAEASATAAVPSVIYFPTGTYAVSPQAKDPADGVWRTIFTIHTGNVTWEGAGAGSTVLKGYMPGLKNPATNWTVTGDNYFKIARFGMFACTTTAATGPVTGTLRFEGLTVDGQCPYTGNSDVGGNPATGDGWDMTHKAFQFDGAKPIARVEIVNCAVVNWRGEEVYSGGTALQSLDITNSTFNQCNASTISCSAKVVISNTTVGPSVYNGTECFSITPGQGLSIENSTLSATKGSAVVWMGVPGATCTITHSTLSGHVGLLLTDRGHNLSVSDTAFTGCTNAVILSGLGQYPQYPKGFSNFAFVRCTFDSANGFVAQGQDVTNLTFTGCTVKSGALLTGTFGTCNGFVLKNTTVFAGARQAGTVNGPGVPLWIGTVWKGARIPATRVDVFQYSTASVTVAPFNEQVWLNQGNRRPGGIAVYFNTTANYPVGFTTRVYASRAGDWVLKADSAHNTFGHDIQVTTAGVTVRFNAQRRWEVVR